MRTFSCQVCQQPVYFENTECTHCGSMLGFLPDQLRLSAVEPATDELWRVVTARPPPEPPASAFLAWLLRPTPNRPVAPESSTLYRKCANYSKHQVCNWMVPSTLDEELCGACRVNEVIPNLSRAGFVHKWYRLEKSKRRLAYGLMRLRLPVRTKAEDPEHGLAFRFMSDLDSPPDQPVMTGHARGTITININEANPALREQMRMDMDEKYRTLLGHFRHEIGHYYWDCLIRDGVNRTGLAGDDDRLNSFREVFGDERKDYGEALQTYYENGPHEGWQDHFVSSYASSHPWEDWAESWAHYLHIVDTLETAAHFSVDIERRMPDGNVQRSDPDFDPYTIAAFEPIIEHWLPLTFALNGLNRSMGLPDLYPFILSQAAIDKLAYIHQVIRDSRIVR